MAEIENTSARDPLLHLLGALGGVGRYVTEMEAAGQRQLVHSDRIPTELNYGSDDELRALGFVLGEPDQADPLFRPATLPAGWTKQGSDHDMWSYIHDQHGRVRVRVFYKAAHYDRRAHASINGVPGYASDLVHDETMPLVVDDWATAPALIEALAAQREQLAENRAYARGDSTRDHTRWIARCDELLARIAQQGGDA